jgi:hypothetical protein
MKENPYRIIIIDNEANNNIELAMYLNTVFKEHFINFFNTSKEALEFVNKKKYHRMVVLLKDLNQLNDLLDVNSRYFYLITYLKDNITINDSLLKLMNRQFKRILLESEIDKFDIIDLIEEGFLKLSTTISACLEDSLYWLNEDREFKVYMHGKTYTYNDIIEEIHKGSEIGIEQEKLIIGNALDRLHRNKRFVYQSKRLNNG